MFTVRVTLVRATFKKVNFKVKDILFVCDGTAKNNCYKSRARITLMCLEFRLFFYIVLLCYFFNSNICTEFISLCLKMCAIFAPLADTSVMCLHSYKFCIR